MARSVFYYHLKRLRTKDKYATEREIIKSIFHKNKGRYSYRHLTSEMYNRNHILNHKTVQWLMYRWALKVKSAKCATAHIKEMSGALHQTLSTETLPHHLQIANRLLM